MSVANALKLRKQQKEAAQQSSTSESTEAFGTPIKLRLRESIQTALTWTTRIEPSKRRLLHSMVPQVMRMLALEDSDRIERFINKFCRVMVYVLAGPGGVMTIEAEVMTDAATPDPLADAPAAYEGDLPPGDDNPLISTIEDLAAEVTEHVDAGA